MIEIACAADRAYLPHAASMIRSVLEHTKRTEVRLHLLHGPALDAGEIERLLEMVHALGSSLQTYVIADDAVEGLPSAGRISQVMWYRILLPDLLPSASRVVYLDCDTIAADDLAALAHIDLQGRAVGAVHNVMAPGSEHVTNLGLPAGQHYFNSGVLVMDLAAWRERQIAQQVIEYGRSRCRELAFPDQDALNVIVGGDRLALDPRWNCQNTLFYWPRAAELFGDETVRRACARPGIVHFEGPELAKPWHYLSKHPYRNEYLRHRANTPWPTDVIEGRTVANRLLRPLPPRAIERALRARSKRKPGRT